jgi:hypothetical protein
LDVFFDLRLPSFLDPPPNSPAWHEKELRNREQDLESGKSKFIDWEKAKADIRRRTS